MDKIRSGATHISERPVQGLRRALVVDDSRAICLIVESVLLHCGFKHVETALDPSAALKRLAEAEFDLVLCDWEMAPLDGLDLLRQARSRPDTRDIPFIMMSAKRDPYWVMEAIRLGANSAITKPFAAATLKQKLGQLTLSQIRETENA